MKFRRTVLTILLVTEYFITLQSSWITLVPRRPGGVVIALFPLPLVLALVAIVVLARLGQGGTRVPASSEAPSATSVVPVGDRTQDNYWKLGVFYFNRDDPAVIIEKRFGLGYTLNFGRLATWLIMLLLLMGRLVQVLVFHLRR